MNHFKFIRVSMACLALAATTQAFAFSRPYDLVAGAVIKDGAPCFYSIAPLHSRKHFYSDGVGVELSVFNASHNAPGYLWDVWFKSWKKALPESPETCVPYGITSPDKNPQPKKALPLDTPLSISFVGEWGRQKAAFCIRKNLQGQIYLSKAVRQDGTAVCLDAALTNESSRIVDLFV